MSNIITSTPKGREGFNISYSDEQECGNELLKKLPIGWKVSFDWAQILFVDVGYEIDKDKKIVEIVYTQNLRRWWKELMKEIIEKSKKLEKKEK